MNKTLFLLDLVNRLTLYEPVILSLRPELEEFYRSVLRENTMIGEKSIPENEVNL